MKSDKTVLVIDSPKDCIECPLFAFECCHVRRKEIPMENITQGIKPEWCPLKCLPKKLPMKSKHMMWQHGWNDCIDEILGDCITQEEADLCGVQFWHDDQGEIE